MSLARRQRRQIAKHFGYLGKKESVDAMRERLQRSQKMGSQLHLQHLERVQNEIIESRRQNQIAKEESLAGEILANSGDSTDSPGINTGAFDFLNNSKNAPLASDEEKDTNVND